ncbi:MAG: acyl-CoA dehydrogenase family protein, partial [Candidatus Rokubacteria bacterium]|nr:acyl-CoA dehydrogenase family protein [Candidatus Rokubacteria bacterium]
MSLEFLSGVQREFHESVRRFADQRIAPQAAAIDETDEFPAALFREMATLGYLGAPYPHEWGGAGADAVMVALLLEEISRASGAVGSSLNAHISLASSVIYHHGS